MLRIAALGLLAAALLGALQRPEPTHPEWGPGPPVAPMDLQPLSSKRVYLRMTFPLIGPSRYLGGFGANRGKFLHTGIDIKAPKMTPIVAPVSGLLGMKRESFWIWTSDGWAILGTHLNDDLPGRRDHAGDRDVMFAPNLVPGEMVLAGQFIG